MSRQYFYEINGQQYGPVSLEDMLRAGVHENTYIWYEGLADWILLKDDVDVLIEYQKHLPLSPPDFDNASGQGYQKDYPNYQQQHQQQMPPNYLVLSIISILCGCLPLGFVALYFSIKVKQSYDQYDYATAELFSKRAKIASIASIVIGVVFSVFYLMIMGDQLMMNY